MFSVRDIQRLNKNKTNIKKETFRAILNKFTLRIRGVYEAGGTNVVLHIPPVMMGFPMYNITQATWYLKRQLDLLGYKTAVPFDGTLYVSWSVREDPVLRKMKPSEPLLIGDSLTGLRETVKKINSRSSQNGGSRRGKKGVH